jgi:serine/threonine protein kinase
VFEAVLVRADGTQETVAAKSLDIVAVGNDEKKIEAARVEMLEEARIMRDVSGHQNVVKALGVTIDRELPLAVMELVRGNHLF